MSEPMFRRLALLLLASAAATDTRVALERALQIFNSGNTALGAGLVAEIASSTPSPDACSAQAQVWRT